MLILTDGSFNGRIVYVVNGKEHKVQTELDSSQIVETGTVAIVFQLFANEAFSPYTDRQYIF